MKLVKRTQTFALSSTWLNLALVRSQLAYDYILKTSLRPSVMQHFLKLLGSTTPRARDRVGLTDSRLQKDAAPLGYVTAASQPHNRLLMDIKGVLHTVAGIFFQALSDHPEIVYISWFWQGSRQINSDVKCIQPS